MDGGDNLDALAKRYRWARLCISFSGGQSSAMMTKQVLDALGERRRNVIVTFANTAQEDERTLRFVHECDQAWGLDVVWLEAVIRPHGTRHRIVTFETASRNGEPFERMIEKYGLPGPGYLHCTRELKLNPTRSFLRSIGWKAGSYDTALGIRADELDRVAEDRARRRLVYPLADLGVTKPNVGAFFDTQNVRLDLPEHLGNCTWCWKKSLRKHLTLMHENPEVFDFPRRMEAIHSHTGHGDMERFFFRGRMTVADLERLAAEPIPEQPTPDFDVGSGCDETCELEAA